MAGPIVGERSRAFEPGAVVAVLGLGLSGEAAARLAAARGGRVYASDISSTAGLRHAAERLRSLGIDAEVGRHDEERILNADLVVVSPGIGPEVPIRRQIDAHGIRSIAEVELAWRDLESRTVAITGTNGKSTTTGLIAHVLEVGGRSAAAAGNIGRPLSDIVLESPQPDWVAVELSSFQLADTETVTPDTGVFLNLSPDHLDRYPNMESYRADKRRLFANAHPGSRWILNADDPAVLGLAVGVPGERFLFSTFGRVEKGACLGSDDLMTCRLPGREETWLEAGTLQLLGGHNVANALAAGLACALAGVEAESIRQGLASFAALEHRLQPIGERDDVLWVNDSKATNVTAARLALRSFERPVVLILGGRHKGEPYTRLGDPPSRLRAVIAFGEATPLIVSDLQGIVEVLRVEHSLEDAVRTADTLARSGDAVLLAPACSSFDMFDDYAHRGRAFVEAFRRLAAGQGSAA